MRWRVLILLSVAVPDAAAQTKILRVGTLWDGSRVLNDAVVVVEGDRITRVMSGADALPPGGEVIDLRRYTALPGLIDLHTHMTYCIERNLDLTRRAVKAGVRLGMGSDAVYTMFGQNTRELGWLVRAGLTPAQALTAATTTAAELLGLAGPPGPTRPGLPRRCRRR